MGLAHSPKTNTSGLVLFYDAKNTNKSWKGETTTNLANTTGGATDWTNNDLGAAVITRTTLEDGNRYELTSTTGGGGRMDFQVSKLTNNLTYNLSLKYRITSSSDASPSFTLTDWCDTSITKTTTAYDSYTYETAYGVRATYDSTYRFMDYSISDNTTVEIWDVQLEERAYATPYTATSRDNTEEILDMIGSNTLTASSLTYGTDNTFSFNGTTDYISVPNIPTVKTVIGWVKCDDVTGTETMYAPNTNGVDNWLAITSSKASVFFSQSSDTNNTTLNGATTLVNGTWYQIACTIDTSTAKIYLNGVEDNTTTVGFTIGAWGGAVAAIGRRGTLDQRYFDGEIDAVLVYDRVLTANEILQNFEAMRGRYGI